MFKKIFFLMLLISASAFSQQEKYVNANVLNVRSGAGNNYEVVTKLKNEEKVTILSENGEWSEVKAENGEIGFVKTNYLADNISKKKSEKTINRWIVIGLAFIILIGWLLRGSNKNKSNTSKNANAFNTTIKLSENLKQEFICKHCGSKNKELWRMTAESCHLSPTKKHQPLERGIQPEYICKHCGSKNKELWRMTAESCHLSPSKRHQPFEGGIQSEYICKHCGSKNKDLWRLTAESCYKSPTKRHQPLY